MSQVEEENNAWFYLSATAVCGALIYFLYRESIRAKAAQDEEWLEHLRPQKQPSRPNKIVPLKLYTSLDDGERDQDIECSCVQGVGVTEKQGERSNMEDSWVVVGDFFDGAFFAVYDGHGGEHAAEYSAANLHQYFASVLRVGGQPNEGFSFSYHSTHKGMGIEIGKNSGTTACTVYYDSKKGMLHVANIGDSRAVVCTGDGSVERLSYDHKCTDPGERQRIEEAGGMIINNRVSGILAVPRSLGDYRAEKYLSREPHIVAYSVAPEDAYLVIACDGLFDVMSDAEVAQFLVDAEAPSNGNAQQMSEALVDRALAKGTTDNCTAIVVKLNHLG